MLLASRLCRAALLVVLSAGCSSDKGGSGPAHPGPESDAGFIGDRDAALASDGGQASRDASEGPLDDAGEPGKPEGLPFPEDFVFGSAVAGFQVDMGCPTLAPAECDDPRSDWYQFTTSPETVTNQDAHLSGQHPSQVGPGFWELYADDIRRADEELHHQAFRFSIEWSRIFPEPTDDANTDAEIDALANPQAVAKYHAILAELKARGMRPLVTLYHYSLPVWIHDAVGCHTDFANCSPKGWADPERTLREIQKYTAFCAREFGAEVDWWATINEPLQNMLFGYVQPGEQRSHPPAVGLATEAAKVVFNALIDGHARMYDMIKAHDTVDADDDGESSFVGVVYPLVPIEPNDPGAWWGDLEAATNIDYLWNRAYLLATALGLHDVNLDKTPVERDDLKGRMDYVGINYYFGIGVSGLNGISIPQISALSPLFTANPFSFNEIPNDPEKLKEFIHWVNDELDVPVMITENGTVDATDDGTTPRFLVNNLKAVQEAIAEGADVRGYFYWSLIDNYEWNHGMDVRMGLYSVDKNDPKKRRVARQGVRVFGTIAKHHVLPFSYLRTYADP